MPRRTEEVVVTADVSGLVRGFATAGAAASGLAHRLDQADGRMANIVQTALAIAPALVPLGAAAVPAIAGLSTELGVAALAAGTAFLAFKGVGTALSALEKFRVAPTAANFATLQNAMKELGPAGDQFVLTLDHMRPKLKALQATAQAGLFPGLTVGLQDVMDLMPRAQKIIATTADGLGQLAQKAAEGLHDEAFTHFFDYIESTARPTLLDLGGTLGNFIEGFANLMVSFGPLSTQFSQGLLGASDAFKKWTAGLSGTKGFQDFVAYIRDNVPRALDALGALATAIVQIIEAAAPVGHTLLPFITGLANGLSKLADSSLGPTIITTAAAIGVLGRSLSLLQTVGLRGNSKAEGISGFVKEGYTDPIKRVLPAMREFGLAQKELLDAQENTKISRGLFAASPGNVNEYTAALQREITATERAQTAEDNRREALRRSFGAIGKAAAVGGGFALAMSGVADKTGLANTATFAMIGSIGGIYGALAGGAIGLVKDMASANDGLNDAVRAANSALAAQPSALTENFAAMANAKTQLNDLSVSLGVTGSGWSQFIHGFRPDATLNTFKDMLGFTGLHSTLDNAKTDFKDLQTAAETSKSRVAQLYEAMGQGDPAKATLAQLESFAQNITPDLQRAGISASQAFSGPDPFGIDTALEKTKLKLQAAFDASQAGKSAAVAKAISHIGDAASANIDPVEALKSALDDLFGVGIDQGQAADDAIRALKAMRKALKDAKGEIGGTGKKALDARDSIRAYGKAMIAKAEADAKATHSGKQTAETLLNARDNFIKSARAANVSSTEIHKMIAQMKLTPKNLTTIIKQDGALSATQKAIAIGRIYGKMPRTVKTIIAEAGSNPTAKKIKALADKYHLLPHEVRSILSAVDNASRKALIAKANAKKFATLYRGALDAKDDSSPKAKAARKKALDFATKYLATLNAHGDAAQFIQNAINLLNAFDGRHADAWVTTHHVTVFSKQTARNTPANPTINPSGATGGLLRGPGTGTSDSIPAWLSNGEFVIKAAAVEHYGPSLFHGLNSMKYADGGPVGNSSERRRATVEQRKQSAEIHKLTAELGKLRQEFTTARQNRKDYANSVRQAFVADPFSGTLGGFNNQIATETRRLTTTQADLKKLRRHGLSGQLLKDLTASGNSALIGQFAHLTPAQLAAEEKKYRKRNSIDYAIGTAAGVASFPQVSELKHEINHLTKEIHQLRHGKHIGNTNFNGRVVIRDSESKSRTKTAASRVRHA